MQKYKFFKICFSELNVYIYFLSKFLKFTAFKFKIEQNKLWKMNRAAIIEHSDAKSRFLIIELYIEELQE